MYKLFNFFLTNAAKHRKRQFYMLTAFISLSSIIELVALALLSLFITSLTSFETVMSSRYILFIKPLVPAYILEEKQTFYLYLGLLSLFFIVLKNGTIALTTYITARLDGAIMMDYGHSVILRFLKAPFVWSSRQSPADIMSLVLWRSNVGGMFTAIAVILNDFIVTGLLLLTLFFFQPYVTGVTLLFLGSFGILLFHFFKKKIHTHAMRTLHLNYEIGRQSTKCIYGLRDILLCNAVKGSTDYLQALLLDAAKTAGLRRVYERGAVWSLESLGFGGLICGALVMTTSPDISSARTMGTLSLLAVSAWRILPGVNRSIACFGSIKGFIPNVIEIQNFILKTQEMESAQDSAKQQPIPFTSTLALKDVSFAYPGKNHPAISNVSLNVSRGESIGIIGSSGAGKSTFIDLLTTIKTPSEGTLSIDGQKLSPAHYTDWRKKFGVVPQKPYLFDGTLAENIAFELDQTTIDTERIHSVCKLSGVTQFMENTPDYLNCKVGEQGSRFSGGHAQRIAIARALYRNPEILIFDEATSALDAKTEKIIQRMFEKIHGDKTVFIVAHRLQTVSHCDKVLWLKNGQVKAFGPREEVLSMYNKEITEE